MISGQSKKLNKPEIKESQETIRRRQSKLVCKQDPGPWRVYRRLLDGKFISFDCLKFKTENKETKQKDTSTDSGCPVFRLPYKDGLRCMCFENAMKVVEDVCRCTPPNLNRSIPAKTSDSWTRSCKKRYKENQEVQFPLSTVVIRWQLKRSIPGYDYPTLKTLLYKYGEIRELRMTSPNTAIVIFDELAAACNVVQSNSLGVTHNKIHCRWWHRAMENKSVYFARKRLKIKQDPFLQH